jgi:hypothetical protein
MSTAKEIAAELNGMEYPADIPSAVAKRAKEYGLVIVYGASDDLMEFEGAIHDELGSWEGKQAKVDSEGLVPEFDQIEMDRYDSKDKLREYFRRENGGKVIEALWCKEGDYSWTFKTEIPHETFEIVEDGEPYCRGIVFSLADAK